jgi:hypothetical protein
MSRHPVQTGMWSDPVLDADRLTTQAVGTRLCTTVRDRIVRFPPALKYSLIV